MEDPKKSLQYLEAVEKLGEEILRDRQEIIALDRRRNQTREGLRALAKEEKDKTWLSLGPMLVKLPVTKAKQLLSQDQVESDTEINKLRSELKVKVNNLRDLEFQPPVPGLMLNALSPTEMRAMGEVLGRHD